MTNTTTGAISTNTGVGGGTSIGKVDISGSEMCIEGKNIKVETNFITMYDGMCDIYFEN